MSKRLSTPTSRLICFGGARALTNDSLQADIWEDEPGGLMFKV